MLKIVAIGNLTNDVELKVHPKTICAIRRVLQTRDLSTANRRLRQTVPP